MTPKSTLALSVLASASILATAAVAQSAANGERTFSLTLTGANEAPGPGDPDGSGTATVTVSVRNQEVCYSFEVSGVEPLTGAHIHEAPSGSPGPIVVPLDESAGSGCETVTARLAAQILARPREYYLNVHTAEFPAGALRDQLG
jgi:hypothetical protein